MFQTAESRYNQWVREHYRFLFRSAWALTGSRACAEDVVQDCFANAWKHRQQLRDQSQARAWLFQIMRRCVWRQVPAGGLCADELSDDEKQAPCNGIDDRIDVVRALGRLAPIHREVLVLYYFDDMPTADMAEALEVAPGTVLSRLSRARDALKNAMTDPQKASAPGAETKARAALRSV